MGEHIIAMNPAQKFIAKKMRETNNNHPQAVTCFDVDMTALLQLKEKHKAQGRNVTITAYLVKGYQIALSRNPLMNSRWINNEIHQYDEFNVGIAMAMDRGLIVPVVKNVETKSCEQISDEIKIFKEKNANGKLTMDDMVGATCTISSLGNGKNDIVLPMLNDDQCVMFGAGSIRKKPVALENGDIVARDIMNMSCTTNHCIVYGSEVGKFCIDVAEILENAEKYLD